ncbi:NACHT domain-containing NTPase [Microcoleus sp. FACHB-SPT15]|uniref:NACHT domain-containing protein n=1 Tax=Microcoleus sp. FACHB-SPT15 TaxID=2692830 RepID=UPI00177BE0A8|nr:NACHT domain-containing NTPase [Microcoleus sp. FACHB-SPT15]MBD1805643.1 NACHT domain-containing NTPase [Microcoleus sp. FACHB-SPT15]
MARRSLQASVEGIKRAKQAFLRKGWTQEYLAGEVGLETRQPIWKFFAGKPVDRGVFSEICFQLDLQPEEIALQLQIDEPTAEEKVQDLANEIDALVTRVRSERHDKIQDQCGTLHLLDIARPVGLDDLYVEVNILEEITSQRWLEISDLQGFKPEEFDRLGLGKVRQEQVPGLKAVERYAKLMVLGKPGAGKTTFLQYLAIQCNQGHFQSGSVPIFIRLKNFAEDALDEGNFSLLNYINQEFSRSGVSEQDVETLLNHGKTLILLDGLDEVPEAASDEVIKQIRKIAEKYYKNQLIITCRIAAQEYRFQGFTEVEIADFKPAQIENFAKKWFVAVARNSPESGLKKASLFLEQMALPEHQPIRELAATPVLLNLTCLVFHAKADFPVKRSDLYKQGLDLLLIRWDESRGVRRDDIYRNLSLPHKLQLLSQLAAITFEQGDYFFEESRLQQLITDYLRTSANAQTNSVTLEQDSLAVVKSIEIQHGLLVERARRIYSFSHLTFQEYFTARAIVTGFHLSLPQLAEHLTEKRWREVFLLTAQMLPNADELLQLMKQQADALVSVDETLQPFLNWVSEKSLEVKTPYKPAAIRAFYLALALPPNHRLASDQTLALAIDRNLAGNFGGDLALDLALVQALGVALALTPELAYNRISALRLALDLNHLTGVEVINDSLKQLKNQLPNSDADQETIKQWWQGNGQDWVSQLRSIMIDHRNIGHEWHLSEASQHLVEQYANASQLLVECLNSNCQLTPTVRQMIEETLLLSHYSFCGVNSSSSCT